MARDGVPHESGGDLGLVGFYSQFHPAHNKINGGYGSFCNASSRSTVLLEVEGVLSGEECRRV